VFGVRQYGAENHSFSTGRGKVRTVLYSKPVCHSCHTTRRRIVVSYGIGFGHGFQAHFGTGIGENQKNGSVLESHFSIQGVIVT
jgi:hypothetical protein